MDDDQLDVVQTPLTPAENAAADADFEAGFAATVGNTTAGGQTLEHDASGKPLVNDAPKDDDAEEDPAAKAAAEEAARLAAEAEARAAAEAEANAPANITKAQAEQLLQAAALVPQLQQELARTRDTTAGKIGSLKQTLDAVQAAAAKGQAPTVRQLKRLEAEFPELAQLLREDLADQEDGAGAPGAHGDPSGDAAASGQPGAAPANTPPADPLSDPRVQHELRQQAQQVVDTIHPDWKDLARTDEFRTWRTTLPPQAQHLLATSWRADVMVPAFNDFKAWRANQAAQAQAAAAAAATANKQRDKRLEHAMPATTGRPTGTNAVDEDAAFLSGFNETRK